MQGTGLGSYVAVGKSTDDTFVEPTIDIPHSGEDIKETPNRLKTESWVSGQSFMSESRVGHPNYSGSITTELTGKSAALFLPHALGGTETVTVDSPSAGRNTVDLTSGGLPDGTLSVKVGRPMIDGTVDHNNFGGGRISELAIEASQDSVISLKPTLTFSSYAGDTSDTSVTAYTPSSVDYWAPLFLLDSTITFDAGGDNVEFCMDKWNLNIKRNLETDRWKTCGLQPAVDSGFMEITGAGEMDFEDRRVKDLFKEATVFDLRILAGNSLGEKIQFDLKCQTGDDANVNVSGPEILKQNVPFQVVHTPGATLAETCTVEIVESVAGL